MSTYKIVIDRSLCSGFGTCADMAPNVFEIAGDGIASTRVGESDDPAVLEAAAGCPMGAIAVYDLASGEQAA
jgi:ferredoxin